MEGDKVSEPVERADLIRRAILLARRPTDILEDLPRRSPLEGYEEREIVRFLLRRVGPRGADAEQYKLLTQLQATATIAQIA